jgi:hypothetical protein
MLMLVSGSCVLIASMGPHMLMLIIGASRIASLHGPHILILSVGPRILIPTLGLTT